MLEFLDDIANKKANKTAKAKAGKKGNSTVSVAEALTAGNGTTKNGTKGSKVADEKGNKAAYLANSSVDANATKNGTAPGKAAKSAAADVVFTALVGLPLLLATLLVL